MPIITLTTDFGMRDGYVGAVKGVIARIAPDARIVDIAHDIPRGDVAHAAWVVATSALEFPHETIHVVVVDPGVGSTRPAVVAKMKAEPPRGDLFFVGPDNGVFAYLELDAVRAIDNKRAMATEVSPTFHGRDVFAHAAAHLALGRGLDYFGPRCQLTGTLPWGERELGHGRIVHIDHYGNLISDLPAEETGPFVFVHGQRLELVTTYADVKPGAVLAYVGSAGTIEIAVRDGRADEVLGVQRGVIVVGSPTDGTALFPRGPYR